VAKQGDYYLIQGTKTITLAPQPGAQYHPPSWPARALPGNQGPEPLHRPQVRINADGSLGAPNDVNCGGIEHKMGLKGSATAT
jgi:hypothetical protein